MKAVFKTDCGKLRDHNEDNGGIFSKDNCLLALVADGMGGQKAGEVASALVVSSFAEHWSAFDADVDQQARTAWLKDLIITTNTKVYEYAESHEECSGMGTTIVAALCYNKNVTVANVGDSRCYFLDSQGDFKQITDDHSLVNQLLKSGRLSEEDAELHPMKHMITRAVGTEPDTDIDFFELPWKPNDLLMLCSDGLTNLIDNHDIADVLKSEGTLDEKADRLIDMANTAGGNDNITVLIIENDDGESI
ncbi:Stp1/IreP family PP2C-type Ser/Thr phosphatase [Camelliibacillus cellulosilyticus]|uniref:Stp1/IreP family PP2C-type Ser/Thr phosphatase n=1 Tax=Camelliibacillus cellulosilyticus TaxID=2174486 RepID=A0ABV9GJ83_9BACL